MHKMSIFYFYGKSEHQTSSIYYCQGIIYILPFNCTHIDTKMRNKRKNTQSTISNSFLSGQKRRKEGIQKGSSEGRGFISAHQPYTCDSKLDIVLIQSTNRDLSISTIAISLSRTN